MSYCPPMARSALLDVVDAAWQLDASPDAWVEGVVSAAATALPTGVESAAYHFRVDEGAVALTAWGGGLDFRAIPTRLYREVPGEELLPAYGLDATGRALDAPGVVPEPQAGLSRALFPPGMVPAPLEEEYRGMALSDAMLFMVRDVGRESFKLVMPLAARRNEKDTLGRHEALQATWSPVAQHLDRALRVRHALSLDTESVVARLDQDGRGEFRDGADQAGIKAAFQHAQRVRNELCAEHERVSLKLWDQLLLGRYSIVRVREQSGALRFLAIENDAPAAQLRRLGGRERFVLERAGRGEALNAIAIDLELHPSVVTVVLNQALRKLGICDRLQLARLADALGAQA